LTFTPTSGFGSQNWLNITSGGVQLEGGLVHMGALSGAASYLSTTTVMSIPYATYASVFIDFVIEGNGANKQRSLTFIAQWLSNGTISFTNYGTVDIGSVSDTNTRLQAVSAGPTNLAIQILQPSMSVSGHIWTANYRLLVRANN